MTLCKNHSRTRSGYTLLEVILAVAIGLILLGALYVAMDGQFFQAKLGRELVEHGADARAISAKIQTDLLNCLRPNDPREYQNSTTSSSSGSGGSTTSTTQQSTTSSSTNTGTGTGTGTTQSTTETTETTTTDPVTQASTTATTNNGSGPINIGLSGGSDWMVVTVGRVPKELSFFNSNSTNVQTVADLRRVIYWMVPGEKGGLARYQDTNVTGGLISAPEEVPEPERWVMSDKVVGVTFEYFNGTDWQETWDSNTLLEDQMTPQGPPAAVRVTLTVRLDKRSSNGEEAVNTTEFVNVIAIPTANNLVPPTTGS